MAYSEEYKWAFKRLTSFRPEIPILRGESNLDRWDNILRRNLALVNLERYIKSKINAPYVVNVNNLTEDKDKVYILWYLER